MTGVSSLSIIVIPKWVRFTVIAILGCLSLIYLGFAIIGVLDSSRPGWIEAGSYVLGTLVPLILLGLILSFSQSGVEALAERTSDYLARGIPALTRLFYEPQGRFLRAGQTVGPKSHGAIQPEVMVQANHGHSIANYKVELDPAKLGLDETRQTPLVCVFRLEINATKANVNILFPCHEGTSRCASVTDLLAHFPHTVEGARYGDYHFSSSPVQRRIDGEDYIGIVCTKKLGEDFLTNPVARLSFGQDLMIMLRSFVNEAPDRFVPHRASAQAPAAA